MPLYTGDNLDIPVQAPVVPQDGTSPDPTTAVPASPQMDSQAITDHIDPQPSFASNVVSKVVKVVDDTEAGIKSTVNSAASTSQAINQSAQRGTLFNDSVNYLAGQSDIANASMQQNSLGARLVKNDILRNLGQGQFQPGYVPGNFDGEKLWTESQRQRGEVVTPNQLDLAKQATTPEELDAVRKYVDLQNHNTQVVQNGGFWGGMIPNSMGQAADPIMLCAMMITGGVAGVAKGASLATKVGAILGSVVKNSAIFGGSVAAQQASLSNVLPNFNKDQAIVNTVGAALFGGVLGAASVDISPAPSQAVKETLGNIALGKIEPIPDIAKLQQDSVGAMASHVDYDFMKQQESPAGINPMVHKALTFNGILSSPVVQGNLHSFGLVRKWTNELFGSPIIAVKNTAKGGYVTSEQPVRELTDMMNSASKYKIYNTMLENGFTPWAKKTGGSFKEYGDGLMDAIHKGNHADPEIQATADNLIGIMRPITQKLQEANILPKGDVDAVSKWGMFSYDKDKILQNQSKFENILTNHYMSRNPDGSTRMAPVEAKGETGDILKDYYTDSTNGHRYYNIMPGDVVHRPSSAPYIDHNSTPIADNTLPHIIRNGEMLEVKEGSATGPALSGEYNFKEPIHNAMPDPSTYVTGFSPEKPKEFNIDMTKPGMDTRPDFIPDPISPNDAAEIAQERIQKILKSADAGVNGALANRMVAEGKGGSSIHDAEIGLDYDKIKEFSRQDPLNQINNYIQHGNSALNFDKFLSQNGARSVADLHANLNEELEFHINKEDTKIAALGENVTPKALAKAEKAKAKWVEDFHDANRATDRMVNIARGIPLDRRGGPFSLFSQWVRGFNVSRLMGGLSITRINETGSTTFRHGVYASAINGHVGAMDDWIKSGANLANLRDYGMASDMAMDHIYKSLQNPETAFEYNPNSITKLIDAGNAFQSKITATTLHTQVNRDIAAHISAMDYIRKIQKSQAGTASDYEMGYLRKAGIAPADEVNILKEYNTKGGMTENGHFPNWSAWNKDTAQTMANAVHQDMNNMVPIATAGDLPTIYHEHEAARLFMQFSGFHSNATNRILLSGAQRLSMGDANLLSGTAALLALSYGQYAAKSALAGRRPRTDFLTAASQALEVSGLGGYLGTKLLSASMFMPSKNDKGQVGQYWTDLIGGPSASLISNASSAIYNGDHQGLTRDDQNNLFNMIPYHNIWYLKQLNRKVYDHFIGADTDKDGLPRLNSGDFGEENGSNILKEFR